MALAHVRPAPDAIELLRHPYPGFYLQQQALPFATVSVADWNSIVPHGWPDAHEQAFFMWHGVCTRLAERPFFAAGLLLRQK
ncbi:hypothetical protein [Comamonas odontotermitis]|uniref:hypothetical protein n=1 Tax=Comamonas odontotermitis TaxID=379895 RepID=UPI0037538C96